MKYVLLVGTRAVTRSHGAIDRYIIANAILGVTNVYFHSPAQSANCANWLRTLCKTSPLPKAVKRDRNDKRIATLSKFFHRERSQSVRSCASIH